MTADDDDGRSRVCDVASVGGVKDFIMSDKPVGRQVVVDQWNARSKTNKMECTVYAIVLFQLNNQKGNCAVGSFWITRRPMNLLAQHTVYYIIQSIDLIYLPYIYQSRNNERERDALEMPLSCYCLATETDYRKLYWHAGQPLKGGSMCVCTSCVCVGFDIVEVALGEKISGWLRRCRNDDDEMDGWMDRDPITSSSSPMGTASF